MDQALQSYLARIVPTVPAKSAQAVIDLAAEGATVPFIARYRKEQTGNLDEVQIRSVIEGHETFNEIVKRKAFLIKEIGEQNNLTAELQKRIEMSWDLGELEEIYKPFKKKKKTKATIAREAGLEPLANWIWDMGHGTLKDDQTMEMKAKAFLNPTAKIVTYEEALKGAQDIIVEKIANDADLRNMVAKNYNEKGRVVSKAAKGFKPNSKYDMYKEFEEPVKALLDAKNNHRYLAMRRGWQEEELTLDVKGDDEEILKSYEKFATSTPDNAIGEYLKQSARLALNVYVLPSVVNEVHRQLKEKADQDAITVFAENVRKLLLASPYGSKCVLGVDPGLRTGCKVALIDKSGAFISHTVLYTLGDDADRKAKALFGDVLKQIQIEAIAVGNGTAGRETEAFLRKVLKDLGKNIPVVMVSESGASVYSASDIAREEFPDLDLTVKGAISIARRLQDPLAELVKVDPKSIGVGQYQHDVNQSQLKKSLEAVVESCVNNVGVDVNTASAALLSHVAGIGPALAKGIVEARKKALFADRSELLKVPKFSAKVFEQAAGFLRIPASKHVLDSTGIHPERYQAVTDMAKDLGVSLSEVIGEGAKKLLAQRTKWAQIVGEFTFDDIVKELEKPGRDPRDPFKVFQYRDDIMEVKDLKEGMICPGIVTNVTNFGAFVDIGVHQDGLVHISALSHKFVDDPRKVVNPGDHVTVKVMKVDQVKNQISLTMKMDDAPEASAPREKRGDQPRQQQGGYKPGGVRMPPGGGAGQRPAAGGPPAKPANPFNNPFAALMNTPTNKK
ncbi:helix-hairpin-helix domain-containing protein [Bdellovibrio sp. NC01]|uniref:helix-hairpin-helix domain-containing protein n=1 Tax=Bdellovibrio sp. NC01 TaxID=2220073 RepID=UPI00115907B2|nr:Tex family protein [Bdellovibrio sp. NC01]QDK36905.1 RNA-binding transcriptional accessory protein [Bdellovibrio sp. NC01]